MSVPGNLPLPWLQTCEHLSSPSSPPPFRLILWRPVSGLSRNRWRGNAPLPFFPLNREKHTHLVCQVVIPSQALDTLGGCPSVFWLLSPCGQACHLPPATSPSDTGTKTTHDTNSHPP
ncbi:unnamed protein product [Protopolystoma xenopodis]|uniref:Uncharacterized protein n=1 Tax=Protopolystoma xenopodis TaxID=117903 RepID=A0A3S5BDS7_9PLAT|nr:unnamed protein product [Protopolystoma xenopodis]